MIPLVLVSIVALAGIGFGIYEMTNGKATTQTSQVDSSTSQNEQKEVKEGMEESPAQNENIVSQNINASDYIYVGLWGIKVKIPDNLGGVSFSFEQHAGYQCLSILGATKGRQYAPDFASPDHNTSSLGSLCTSANDGEYYGEEVYSDSLIKLYYDQPQAPYSMDDEEIQWELESISAIEQMFRNNISAL